MIFKTKKKRFTMEVLSAISEWWNKQTSFYTPVGGGLHLGAWDFSVQGNLIGLILVRLVKFNFVGQGNLLIVICMNKD